MKLFHCMTRRPRHYVFGLSACSSEAWNTFHLHMDLLVHPTKRDRFAPRPSTRPPVCPSVQRGFLALVAERMEWMKFCRLIYLDDHQNWLNYGHYLLFFLLLVLLWLSETGHILGFHAFPGERMEGMAWYFACWCILTTFRNSQFMVTVCSLL